MQTKSHGKELPLYRKIFLFSFFLTLLIVISTAGFVFIYQTKQLEGQLTDQAMGVASLWCVTIDFKDVQIAIDSKDRENPIVKKLNYLVTLVNDRNSRYLDGYIVDANKLNENQVSFVSISKQYEELGLSSFHHYTAGKEFLSAYETTIREKKENYSQIYRDPYGMWITAFHPILNEEDKVIALFAVDVDASIIETYKKKIAMYLFFALIIISSIVYFTLRWGFKKALKPVQEIITGINAVSAGNFNVKLEIKDQADLDDLSEKFNHMTEKLSILFERLSDTSKEFGSSPAQLGQVHRIEEAIGEMENIIAKTKIRNELQRAEKMNAIGQLAASVAHEIRNPMTVVRGFLQIFLAKEHLSSEELMYVQLMIDELNRAEMIINDYLSLAKPDLDQVEKVNASELAEKVMDLMNSFALMSQNITLSTDFDEDVNVKGNKSELKQVLINIVKNGIEAMKSGGKLELKVFTKEEYGIFEITDSGIGMSPEELERLGTAFYSLKEKGTGIGMMVCYQLVDKMKGQLDVISKPGKGTTFKVHIPLWKDE